MFLTLFYFLIYDKKKWLLEGIEFIMLNDQKDRRRTNQQAKTLRFNLQGAWLKDISSSESKNLQNRLHSPETISAGADGSKTVNIFLHFAGCARRASKKTACFQGTLRSQKFLKKKLKTRLYL